VISFRCLLAVVLLLAAAGAVMTALDLHERANRLNLAEVWRK
jgi:hypothetical protein